MLTWRCCRCWCCSLQPLSHLSNHSSSSSNSDSNSSSATVGSISDSSVGGAPVLVFLHGGSFQWGSSSIFDGSKLAAAEHIVVVTLNYRLGVLGMMPTPRGEANFGIMDQQMALQWVYRWVHRFGGDRSSANTRATFCCSQCFVDSPTNETSRPEQTI